MSAGILSTSANGTADAPSRCAAGLSILRRAGRNGWRNSVRPRDMRRFFGARTRTGRKHARVNWSHAGPARREHAGFGISPPAPPAIRAWPPRGTSPAGLGGPEFAALRYGGSRPVWDRRIGEVAWSNFMFTCSTPHSIANRTRCRSACKCWGPRPKRLRPAA